jgi:hypothetical protein
MSSDTKLDEKLMQCSEQIQEDMICLIDSKEFVVGQLEAILKDALCEIVVSNFERLEVEK